MSILSVPGGDSYGQWPEGEEPTATLAEFLPAPEVDEDYEAMVADRTSAAPGPEAPSSVAEKRRE